jgi:type I restriction enzyme M protein
LARKRVANKESADSPKQTTTQQLGSLVKSARDIMRKDKGLSGDLDRLPMLTWIMFLKFLDDMEQIEESRAKLARKQFKPAVEPPYRWRDWADDETGITGPELLAFINQEEARRPDGSKGPGLFAYLRNLQARNGEGDRRTVIATVFNGVINRMTSGYLLRDIVNKVAGIHFTAQEELFTLGTLYESMLKEMSPFTIFVWRATSQRVSRWEFWCEEAGRQLEPVGKLMRFSGDWARATWS